jgi:hypothetical protein
MFRWWISTKGRLISNVIECPPDQVKNGMSMEALYEDDEGYTLSKFRPMKRVVAAKRRAYFFTNGQFIDKP